MGRSSCKKENLTPTLGARLGKATIIAVFEAFQELPQLSNSVTPLPHQNLQYTMSGSGFGDVTPEMRAILEKEQREAAERLQGKI